MARTLVIIPAYNEAETVADVISAIHRLGPLYSVVVIDDGSTDATAAVAKRAGADVIQLPFNLGIGGAMQTGYRYALRNDFDVAVQCDADGQHPVHQIPRLVSRVLSGSADLVVGSRYVAASDYRPSFSRRVGKSLLSRLVDAVTGDGITDTTSGFRAANRAVIAAFARVYPDDYPEAEALVTLHKAGLRTAEVPVDMRSRQGGRSSISPRRAAYYIIKVSLAIFIGTFKAITRTPETLPPDPVAQPEAETATTSDTRAA